MKYMGSKRRVFKEFKHLLDLPRTYYVEPFVGGANSLVQMTGGRIACDNNFFLIEMWRRLQQGWEPPNLITEELYNDVRDSLKLRFENGKLVIPEDKYEPALVAYVAFSLSWGGKWFGGYRRDKKGAKDDPGLKAENEIVQSRRAKDAIMKMVPLIGNVEFYWLDYVALNIPDGSVIYCDPPHAGTTQYKDSFDHERFWRWVRYTSKKNKVFVSEFTAPDDFKCIWEQPRTNGLNKDKATEKLFVYEGI